MSDWIAEHAHTPTKLPELKKPYLIAISISPDPEFSATIYLDLNLKRVPSLTSLLPIETLSYARKRVNYLLQSDKTLTQLTTELYHQVYGFGTVASFLKAITKIEIVVANFIVESTATPVPPQPVPLLDIRWDKE